MNRVEKKSKIIDRIKKRWKKAVLSVTLTAAMVACNIGGQVSTVMAGDYSDMAVIELEGANLYDSIQAAIEGDAELSADDIRFTNGKIEQYMKLFYGGETKEGNRLALNGTENVSSRILEFYPDYEGDMEIELRAFVRLPLDAGDDYVLTGEEEVIFLYINNSDDTVKCIVSVDGRKRGRTVTIKGYEEAFGEDEVNLISVDPNAQETDAATGEITDQESADQETVEQESSEGQEPTDGQETTEDQGTPEGQEPSDGQETPAGQETTEDQEPTDGQETPDRQESQDEAEEKEATEEKEEIREDADSDREVKSEEKEEKDQPETEEITASISIHRVPLVAAEEDGGAVEHVDSPEESERDTEEKIREVKDAGDDELPIEDVDKSNHPAETPETVLESDPSRQTGSEEPTQGSETEEGMDPAESGETAENTDHADETDIADGSEVPESTESADPSDGAESSAAETETPMESSVAVETETVAAEEIEGKDTQESLREGMYQLVGIDGCSTAKAYVTNINHLGINLERTTGFFYEQEMADGVTITLKADSKAARELTDEVTAEVMDVSDDVKLAIAKSTGADVEDVVVYDVNLFDANGLLIENGSWDGSVSVSFSGEKIEEISQRTSLLSIVHDQSETPGNQEGLDPEQLDLQIVSSVDTTDTIVEKVEGEVSSFCLVGAAGQNLNLDGGIPVKDLVESGELEIANGKVEQASFIKTNGDIAWCISPFNMYPSLSTFENKFRQYKYEDFIGKKINPGTLDDSVYNEDGLLLAGLVAQIGYPDDPYGLCKKRDKVVDQTQWAIHKCVSDLSFPERENGEIPDSYKYFPLAYELIEKAIELRDAGNGQEDIQIITGDDFLKFEKIMQGEEGIWVTGEFSLESSRPFLALQELDENINIQKKSDGDRWENVEVDKVPTNSILRLYSDASPVSGKFLATMKKVTLELAEGNCFVYSMGEELVDGRPQQNLLVLKTNEREELVTLEIGYANPSDNDTPVVPDPPDVPDAPDTPDVPDTPVQPTIPDTPSGGSDGSSGGGSGGGDSSGGRYTPDTGGPGTAEPAVVNLADVDVPLASLPVMPTGEVIILDDDVPLASLPKTGDKRGAENIAFSVSGVLLAVYCLLKRRKSSENHIRG